MRHGHIEKPATQVRIPATASPELTVIIDSWM